MIWVGISFFGLNVNLLKGSNIKTIIEKSLSKIGQMTFEDLTKIRG